MLVVEEEQAQPGGNCIKIGLPGKSILRDYYQENRISGRPFLLLRISFPGRPIFIQFVPGLERVDRHDEEDAHDPPLLGRVRVVSEVLVDLG